MFDSRVASGSRCLSRWPDPKITPRGEVLQVASHYWIRGVPPQDHLAKNPEFKTDSDHLVRVIIPGPICRYRYIVALTLALTAQTQSLPQELHLYTNPGSKPIESRTQQIKKLCLA